MGKLRGMAGAAQHPVSVPWDSMLQKAVENFVKDE